MLNSRALILVFGTSRLTPSSVLSGICLIELSLVPKLDVTNSDVADTDGMEIRNEL